MDQPIRVGHVSKTPWIPPESVKQTTTLTSSCSSWSKIITSFLMLFSLLSSLTYVITFTLLLLYSCWGHILFEAPGSTLATATVHRLFSSNLRVRYPLLCCTFAPGAFKPFCILKVPPCLGEPSVAAGCGCLLGEGLLNCKLSGFNVSCALCLWTAVLSASISDVSSLFPSLPPQKNWH